MTKIRSIADILSHDDNSEELYHTDEARRKRRAKMGRFTKSSNTFDFIHLVKNWDKIVGPMLAQNTIPLKIKSRNLFILTKHAVFSQELGFMVQLIIDKIEEQFPNFKGQIKKIRFASGDYSSEEFNAIKEKKGQIKKLIKTNLIHLTQDLDKKNNRQTLFFQTLKIKK